MEQVSGLETRREEKRQDETRKRMEQLSALETRRDKTRKTMEHLSGLETRVWDLIPNGPVDLGVYLPLNHFAPNRPAS
jgi:hypothetical protein